MCAERFGSYSIAATFAGTPSLRRLKSTLRYLRLAPPPRWREVTRPCVLRPPDLVRPSVSDFSGSLFVTASCCSQVAKRRPGEVGLCFLIAIRLCLLALEELDRIVGVQRHHGLLPLPPLARGPAAPLRL